MAARTMEGHESFWTWLAHSIAGSAILGTLVGLLPPIVSVIAGVFYVIQICESKTVKDFLNRRRDRKLTRLKQAIERIQAAKDSQ